MNSQQRQQAVMLTEEIMRTYYCKRDIYAILDRMAPDASWIGPGEQEKKYTLDEMRAYFEMGKDAVPPCEVSNADLRVVDLAEDLCLVTGSMDIRTTPESQLILEVNQRVSVTFRLVDGALQVVHMHNSNPYGEMDEGEYFPHKIGSQSYQYLQRLIREKTEVIDMIASNITGGLKGSNDDSTFSYFYVNEGLPRMLGFTYDEFMAKTGGTATGAAYPPDLPAAMAECVRCFAQGPVYSIEYRMEKKDGSLIWVLDSGRKALDSEGVTRINSIVTDITPLKQALFDLEVERERYRIALGNITGSMCEYDIAADLLTVYRKTDSDAGRVVEELEFAQLSKLERDGAVVRPEDVDAFLELCTGQCSGTLEFSTCLFRPGEPWRWYQFSCSVITDSTGLPVRSIGMLKDITEDKKKNLALLEQAQRDGLTQLINQTAAKEAIQSYLTAHYGHAASTLLMVDLDHFKEINDTKGHLFGNDVLVKVARILEEVAGNDSIVGRNGGDEFIILLKETERETVIRLAEEIIKRVSKIELNIAYAISCSVGIACQRSGDKIFCDFFDRADRALYCAKDRGRNRWAMDGE